MMPKLPFSRKNNQKKSHPSEQPSVNSTKPETKSKQSIITRIGQLLPFWTNNQNKSHPSEQPSVNSSKPEKKNTILSWLMEFGQKSLLIKTAILTASGAILTASGSVMGSSRLCVIIFAYGIVKCLLGKTFMTILRIFYQYRPRFHTETRRAGYGYFYH